MDVKEQDIEFIIDKVQPKIATSLSQILAEITGGELRCNSSESLEIKFLNNRTYHKTY
jgi:hypothetical protein